MRKRSITLLVSIVLLLCAVLAGCSEEEPTQEEFKVEYIDIIKKLDIFVFSKDDTLASNIKITLDKNVEIYEEDLKVKLHVYELSSGSQNGPSAEEVKSLYYEYDKDNYQKLQDFFLLVRS